jgi:hypothetical protein
MNVLIADVIRPKFSASFALKLADNKEHRFAMRAFLFRQATAATLATICYLAKALRIYSSHIGKPIWTE